MHSVSSTLPLLPPSLSTPWNTNCADHCATPETVNNNDLLVREILPALDGYAAATVIEDRMAEMLTAGFKGINYTDMVTNGLENYFIVNYFSEADYNGTGGSGVPGHIEGAYQFTPAASMGLDQMLPYIPTDMPVVVYCWTGQTSSQVTAYLNSLGYEAYSLKFGSNNLFHSLLTGHKWNTDGSANNFPLVPTL